MSFNTAHSDKSDSDSEFDHEQPSPTSSLDDESCHCYFAFARIKGDVCLVQASSSLPLSPLSFVDVKVFRHEFISIFRLAGQLTLHPADISILELIDSRLTKYEEENDTVFLARNVMERLRKLTDPRWGAGQQQQRRYGNEMTMGASRGYGYGHGRSRSMGSTGQQQPLALTPSRITLSTSSSPSLQRQR